MEIHKQLKDLDFVLDHLRANQSIAIRKFMQDNITPSLTGIELDEYIIQVAS